MAIKGLTHPLLNTHLMSNRKIQHNYGRQIIAGTATAEEMLQEVREYPSLIRLLKPEDVTMEMCLIAIEHGVWDIQCIPKKFQLPEVHRAAIKQDPYAIQFIKSQTPNLCHLALTNDPETFECIRDECKTVDLCLQAVKADGVHLNGVPAHLQTFEVCLAAARHTADAIDLILDPKLRAQVARHIDRD
jgi:hypothetical protein